MTQKKYRGAHNFFYNIRFDYQAVLKHLDHDLIKELYKTSKTTYGDYRIKYIPKRMFSLTKDKHVHKFYDIAQFYEMSLEAAAAKYIQGVKNEDNLDRNLIGTSATYWKHHYDEIVKYCIKDCELTAELGVLLNRTLEEKLHFRAQSFVSKAGLSKEYFRKYCDIPEILDIPKGAISMFMEGYSAGRFEVFRKGFIPKCVAIDVNSAYSKAISMLPDITKGEWKKVNRWTRKESVGIYLCKINGYHEMAAPHRFRLKSNLIVYPSGEYYTTLTNWEIKVFKDDLHITVIRGWEFYAAAMVYPFADRMKELYNLKASTVKTEYEYDLYKKIMNSLYGSFYEKRQDGDIWYAGKLFNPIYATLVTAYCRIQLWKVIRDYHDHIISAATDGLILDKMPNIKMSKNMGEWSVEGRGDVVMLRSGLYRIGDKVKSRGVGSFKGIRTKYRKYDDIFEYILDEPDKLEYPIVSNRPLNLGECIVHHKAKSLDMMNVFVDQDYTITINRDLKRIWDDTFTNGGELFDIEISSRPLLIN